MSINTFIGQGRMVRDPELRSIPSGTEVCDFTIAIDSGYGDKKTTCFIGVTCWGAQGVFVSKHFKKGSPINVEGRLDLETWMKDDEKRSKHKITAQKVSFVVGASSGSTGEPANKLKETFGGSELNKEEAEKLPF